VNHIGNSNKMVSDTPRTESFKCYDSGCDDPLYAWGAFAAELECELNAANDRIRLLIAERDTARLQADRNYKLRDEFRELLGTDDVERGVAVVREIKERIKRLEEELERTKEDRNAIAKNTREPLLLKLDHANERISKLNDYVAALETSGDLMANELSYGYDVDMWNKAKEDKL
jgi:tetrahydromethanopterin S-methyltransferase subunit B